LRIALLTDVHANLAALSAVLAHIDRAKPDHIFVLGDLVGRGPEPEAVARLIARRKIVRLRGNWDEWVAGLPGWDGRVKRKLWIETARLQMRPKTAGWLARAPQRRRLRLEGMTIVLAHGSPRDPIELLTPATPDDVLAAAIAEAHADVVCVGHSHQPFVKQVGATLVVNAGTVGYAFNGDPRATYALVELQGGRASAQIVRVPYALDRTLAAMTRAVKRNEVAPELAARYRRALFGEGPEPEEGLHAGDRGGDVLIKLLAKRVRAVYDPELFQRLTAQDLAVRDLRAATRRLREALALARPICDERRLRRAETRLAELGRIAGKRRIADVVRDELNGLRVADAAARERIHVLLDRRRKRITGRLLGTYAPERLLDEGLAAIVVALHPRDETMTVASLAHAALESRWRASCRALTSLISPDLREEHHTLRIMLRRLRDLAAMLLEPFPGEPLETLHALVKNFASKLGRLNDAYDLAAMLETRRIVRAIGRDAAAVLARENEVIALERWKRANELVLEQWNALADAVSASLARIR
jgi:putative phosphoesterase